MPAGRNKRHASPLSTVATPAGPENQLRLGMPARDSVHSRTLFASPKPGGKAYRIIRTTEVDAYEAAAPVGVVLSRAALLAKPVGDAFKGTARKAAKIAIASAKVESFGDLRTLINSLLADDDMVNRTPRIGVTAKSGRVKEEKRNVRVRAFLYAASRENDNDFHLIIGRNPIKTPELYMTVEVSGLPPKSSAAHKRLKTARDAFKTFFDADLPGMTYDFYDPPIPLDVQGSLFFDMNHASGQRPGPASLKSRMPTIWEIHPVSDIVFEP